MEWVEKGDGEIEIRGRREGIEQWERGNGKRGKGKEGKRKEMGKKGKTHKKGRERREEEIDG